MNQNIFIEKSILENLYITQNLSQKTIAKKLNLAIDNIPIILSDTQIEVLNGALLGDGHLTHIDKNRNSCLSYTSKSKQHVKYVMDYFTDYITNEGLAYRQVYDKRTLKVYENYKFRTQMNETLTIIRNKWYINRIKIIPTDLILTPLTCLIWYIGDGCLMKNKNYIKLSTHCFTYDELQNIIIPQLKQFDAKLSLTDKTQYYVYIPRKFVKNFLKYIGECPFSDYSYKWDAVEYKNNIPSKHTSLANIFVKHYTDGMEYCRIADMYNVDPSAVRYYLIKHNVYQKLTRE